jgi:pyruvate-formate lyase-activating enzyme
VIFQESSQYIDAEALFHKAAELTSRVLVLDEFALSANGEQASGGTAHGETADALHSLERFQSAAAAAGFQVVEEIDLSARAALTVDYFLDRLPRHRDGIVADLGVSHEQIDALIASGSRYREWYRNGHYGYRLLDLRGLDLPGSRGPGPASLTTAAASTGATSTDAASTRAASPVFDPFVHVSEDRLEHPITGRTLTRDDDSYAVLSQLAGSSGRDTAREATNDGSGIVPAPLRETLVRDGWLVEPHPDLTRRSRLRIVTIETHTACNQTCYFCPVSIAPRDAVRMPDALFDAIVLQLRAYSSTLEGVFLSGYNEPTLDPRFVDQCAGLLAAELPVAVTTNATGLTPARVDQLARAGMLRLLTVNISTLDRDRYAHDRGRDHLDIVLRHLDYAGDRPVAREMIIAVLGTGDAAHHADFDAMRTRFAGSRFDVRFHVVMDRAGHLQVGLTPDDATRGLRGCENLGSRPLQHLHITAAGSCVFCCEDYDEQYVVGNLATTTIPDILRGDELARLRRWSYGLEAAPDDFICRKCIFALRR